MTKASITDDPFKNLPRRPMFGVSDEEVPASPRQKAERPRAAAAPDPNSPNRPAKTPRPRTKRSDSNAQPARRFDDPRNAITDEAFQAQIAKYPVVNAALHKAELAETAQPARRGRGRPAKEGPRPWEALGINRRTYFRRKKEGKL